MGLRLGLGLGLGLGVGCVHLERELVAVADAAVPLGAERPPVADEHGLRHERRGRGVITRWRLHDERRGHRGGGIPGPACLLDVARPPDMQHMASRTGHEREQRAQHRVTPPQLERPRGGPGRVAGAPLERAARVVAEAAAEGVGGGAL